MAAERRSAFRSAGRASASTPRHRAPSAPGKSRAQWPPRAGDTRPAGRPHLCPHGGPRPAVDGPQNGPKNGLENGPRSGPKNGPSKRRPAAPSAARPQARQPREETRGLNPGPKSPAKNPGPKSRDPSHTSLDDAMRQGQYLARPRWSRGQQEGVCCASER
jgi:hypothetical protein